SATLTSEVAIVSGSSMNRARTAMVEPTPSRITKTAARVTKGQAGVFRVGSGASSWASPAGRGEAAEMPGGGPAGRSIVASPGDCDAEVTDGAAGEPRAGATPA